MTNPQPPVAPKRPHNITQHGQTRTDNYFWLRYRDDPEVMRYLKAESQYLDDIMRPTLPLQEKLFIEMKACIKETDTSAFEKNGRFLYYKRTEQGKQYPLYCRKEDKENAVEQVILDQNELAEGRTFCRIAAFSVSPDGNKLAYSIDPDGSEKCVLYIKDLTSGNLYPEIITNTFGEVYTHNGVEWANDSENLFYLSLDSAQKPYKLYRHTIDTSLDHDLLIFQEADEKFFLYLVKTRSKAYIMTYHVSTTSREMRFLPADHPEAPLQLLQAREPGIEYIATHLGDWFYLLTNENARNFRVMRAPVIEPQREHWVEVVPHRPDVLVEDMEAFSKHLVLVERRGGLPQVRISASDGVSNVNYVAFPDPAYVVLKEKNPEFESQYFRFTYTSLTTPNSVVDIDMDTLEWNIRKEEEIPSRYDKTDYVTERIHATAADGTRVPVSIIYKKGLKKDGKNPCLLYSYGSYGYSTEPAFNASRLSLLERGFVFAMGHIRGGSELGRAWYEDGKMLNKRNTFTDFIACAETLISEGYTSRENLAIQGGSAGGLLVTAATTMRPDLFKAVIAKVPFVDVVNSMSDPTIPLTTVEYDQWGNPEIKEYFDYIMSYSPYDNIRVNAYPHMLITTGLNDPRVAYWEPAKFTAKLRELKTDNNRLLLKTNYDAGHAGASGRYDFLKEIAFDYAFLIDALQIKM